MTETMTEISVGDVVQLRSGGPRMTINSRTGGTRPVVNCLWFTDNHLEAGSFNAESVVKVPTDRTTAPT